MTWRRRCLLVLLALFGADDGAHGREIRAIRRAELR